MDDPENTPDYDRMAWESGRKRLAWLDARGHPARPGAPFPIEPISPRRAYELLLLQYMGLPATQVPVIEESGDRIVWHSANPCPTLEYCLRAGEDTRRVCRRVSERPAQVFLTRLDPRLRFVRDYDMIRPYAPYCRESIVRVDLEAAMERAITEARQAKAEGNKGYGAVVLMGDRVLATAHDTGATGNDPSLHAEHSALRAATSAWDGPDLTGSLLVSTCEPCPMCTGLAVWAGVTTIVFGSSIADTAAMGRSRIMVSASEIVERAPVVVEVVGGVLKERCDALYR